MSASALPSATGLQALRTVDDLRGFLHVGDDLWAAIVHQVGDPGPHVRLIAALPAQVVVQSSMSAVLPTGDNLTAIQATYVGLLWRTSRKMVHIWAGRPEEEFVDVGPWAVVGNNTSTAVPNLLQLMQLKETAVDKLKNVS